MSDQESPDLYVSYVYVEGTDKGLGYAIIPNCPPIRGAADLTRLHAHLKETEGLTNVAITNWRRFEE